MGEEMATAGPNLWFRVRHPTGFSPEVFEYFRAACRVYEARIESILANWEDLPGTKGTARPTVRFLEAELGADGSVASLPMVAENVTLGSRSLLQEAAKDLYAFLPVEFMVGVEVGITEPSFTEKDAWRDDWWNPHRPASAPTEETLAQIRKPGGRIVDAASPKSLLGPGRDKG
jgi:hypothetical protein